MCCKYSIRMYEVVEKVQLYFECFKFSEKESRHSVVAGGKQKGDKETASD